MWYVSFIHETDSVGNSSELHHFVTENAAKTFVLTAFRYYKYPISNVMFGKVPSDTEIAERPGYRGSETNRCDQFSGYSTKRSPDDYDTLRARLAELTKTLKVVRSRRRLAELSRRKAADLHKMYMPGGKGYMGAKAEFDGYV